MGLNKMLSIERGRRGLRKSGRLWVTSFFFFWSFKLFILYWGVLAKSLQLCLTLCDPMDCSCPGSSVHGILQARILEWIVISSSRESSQSWDWTPFSYVSCIGRRVLYHQHHLEGFPGSSDSKDWLYSKYFHPFSIKNRTHNTEKHGWLCSET